jgi:hypothetical protein
VIRFSQGIQPEDETPVSQGIGLDAYPYAAIVLEQLGSDYVIGVQTRGLPKDQRTIFRRFLGTGNQRYNSAYG